MGRIQASKGRRGDEVLGQKPFLVQRVQNEASRRRAVLSTDGDEQLTLRRGQGASSALVRTRSWPKRIEATTSVAVQPALQGTHTEAARSLGPRGEIASLTEHPELRLELTPTQITTGELTDKTRSEKGHRFWVVARFEGSHVQTPFSGFPAGDVLMRMFPQIRDWTPMVDGGFPEIPR